MARIALGTSAASSKVDASGVPVCRNINMVAPRHGRPGQPEYKYGSPRRSSPGSAGI